VANEGEPKPANPLVRQVDTLRRSHDAETEVPVLTEIVERSEGPDGGLDPLVLEALARQLERAVLDHFGPEFNRLVEERLASALSARLEQSVAELRAELVAGLDQMAREAVASAVANTFRARSSSARASATPDLFAAPKKTP
jgi:aminopeptidase N